VRRKDVVVRGVLVVSVTYKRGEEGGAVVKG